MTFLSKEPGLFPVLNTSTVLIATNPVLLKGQIATETDTNRSKSGDGSSTYTELTYVEWQYEIIEAAGTDTYTGNFSKPYFLAYFPLMRIRVRFTNGNTGASTINLNGLGAIAIRKNVSTALASGDIVAGGIYELSYDGTNFQLLGVPGTIFSGSVTPAALTKVDDTNVTLTLGGTPATALLQAVSVTVGWTGLLSLARGGTNANLTASIGGIFYSTGTAGAILAGTATAGQMLRSGASAAPTWSTNVWPNTTAVNHILYATSANVISSSANLMFDGTSLMLGQTVSVNAIYKIQSSTSAASASILNAVYSTTDSHVPSFIYLKSNSNTIGTGAATASGEALGSFSAAGHNSSNAVAQPIGIEFYQDGAGGATFIPGRIDFLTGTAAAARTQRLVIKSTGEILIGTTAIALAEVVNVTRNQNAGTYTSNVNTTSGTAAYVATWWTSDGSTLSPALFAGLFSAAFTTTGIYVAASASVHTNGTTPLSIGTRGNADLSFWTNLTKKVEISAVGNVSIGGVAVRATTVGTNALQIFDGTAPVGTLANGVSLHSLAGVLKSINAAGLAGFVNVSTDAAAAPATNAIGVIVDYYGSSATRVLTTPNSWEIVTINGTVYKRPLYT